MRHYDNSEIKVITTNENGNLLSTVYEEGKDSLTTVTKSPKLKSKLHQGQRERTQIQVRQTANLSL